MHFCILNFPLPLLLLHNKMQVLSDFDIFAIVGANKPLQLVDSRVSVKEGGALVIRFEGINGSPVVSGICVRRASNAGRSFCLSSMFKLCQIRKI